MAELCDLTARCCVLLSRGQYKCGCEVLTGTFSGCWVGHTLFKLSIYIDSYRMCLMLTTTGNKCPTLMFGSFTPHSLPLSSKRLNIRMSTLQNQLLCLFSFGENRIWKQVNQNLSSTTLRSKVPEWFRLLCLFWKVSGPLLYTASQQLLPGYVLHN